MGSQIISTLKIVVAMMLICGSALAAPVFKDSGGKPASAYLPKGVTFDPTVPTPASFLGAEVGTWHVRHHQLVAYMYALAAASDRVTVEVTGHTHENRPLLLLTITDPKNRNKLTNWRQAHLDTVNQGAKTANNAPLFFYLGYSIHGNEPSGSNAALIMAYYLAAGEDDTIAELLNENVVLFDPSLNPDGLSRFAHWANMHKGKNLVSDPLTREHIEVWPRGRTNHYWFDLNRDWLLLTHPESQARIKNFQKWRPHILTDHHEMGSDSTYFFQPGVPSRKNPNTPDGNVRLTEALAGFHAKAFDDAGQLYFSEEAFDDFYYGKGSSYPDSLGSIGILFEQASSRGHVQDTINGELAFAQTIQNQVTTTLSTIKGALANKPAILTYQNTFYDETSKAIKDDEDFAGVIALPNDKGRIEALTAIFEQHGIEYKFTNKELTKDEQVFPTGSIVVPFDQPKYRLVKSLFSTRQSFAENTFYDVSNWNIALAFNLDYAVLSKRDGRGIKFGEAMLSKGQPAVDEIAYAYAFEWNDYFAPAMLQQLLEAGVAARSTEAPFSATLTDGREVDFGAGSIVIPTPLSQPIRLVEHIREASRLTGVEVYSLASGLTPKGADLGSRTMSVISQPEVLVVGGEGTSSSEAGEIWHYLDTRVGFSPSIIEKARLDKVNFADYSHIIFVSGSYGDIADDVMDRLTDWVRQGGVLIGQKTALRFFVSRNLLDADVVGRETIDRAFPTESMGYKDKAALAASKIIAGAVYNTNIDTSHPLFFGYTGDTLPVFKTSNMIIRAEKNPFTQPAFYTEKPLMAGFSASQLQDMIADSSAVLVQQKGKGVVIGFVDNTLFRGYWYGTGKLMGNAIYQSTHLVR